MSVDQDTVRYMANLARLRLKDEEIAQYQTDMNKVLAYMDQLNEVNTADVAPLEHVLELPAVYREDVAKTPLDHTEALKNAPDANTDYFKVPRVIE
jgi:aspartyl-tRNA(Asn)/glutamyl-tRNA(Gln) amidotransferase subunit C